MIVVDIERCSGCSRCEVHCSFFRSGRIARTASRIKVVKLEAQGIDFPVVCRHCKERYCTKCPEAAITIGDLGQIIVSPTLCTDCGICETLCPIGAIEINASIPYVCDLCGGDPHCVKACTLDAIRFDPHLSETVSLKSFKKGSGKLLPENKRVRFALASAEEMRRKWIAERSA